MERTLPNEHPLSGTDYFQFIFDCHTRKCQPVGNVIRIQLNFDQEINASDLFKSTDSSVLHQIGSIRLKKNGLFQLPYWSATDTTNSISIEEHSLTEKEFEDNILRKDIDFKGQPLLHIDVVKFPTGKTSIVISANHALLDHKGMINFIKLLDGKYDLKENGYFPKVRSVGFLKQLVETIQVSFFLLWKPARPLAKLLEKKRDSFAKTKFSIINFTEEETRQIDQKGAQQGARLGKSLFYLAATTRALHQMLKKRRQQKVTFWIPIPQDQRPRGTDGSLLSNQLSILFYKIPSAKLDSLNKAISCISDQMKNQIRKNIPGKYASLMSLFRRLPVGLYLALLKLPTGGAISSFSFSDLGEAGDRLQTFKGREVEDLINYPPNPSPPGFTIVFMRFKGALRAVVGYVEEAIKPEELEYFERNLRSDLLTGNLS